MRSSKNRSRSKGNRNRNGQGGGNIVNRVFDSSGPEGKVRGTPQQIVDKYNQLTRDAQLAGDRVAAESFQQHAEHYTRMLAEAMREQEAKQAQHQANQQNHHGGGNQQGGDTQGGNQGNNQGGGNRRNRGGGQDQQNNQQANQQGGQQPDQKQDQAKPDQSQVEQPAVEAQGSFDAVIEPVSGDSGLVETPESTPKPKRPRTRRRKADTPPKDAADAPAPEGGGDKPPQEAAE